MRMRIAVCSRLAIIITAALVGSARAEPSATPSALAEPVLVQAVVCERVENLAPENRAVVFPLEQGEVACFTAFDPVPEETVICHRWFFRNRLSARVRLRVKPPRWSSFSRIQLRPGDVGPWRVDITDADGKLLARRRFSVVE